jgi:hypothetical protein
MSVLLRLDRPLRFRPFLNRPMFQRSVKSQRAERNQSTSFHHPRLHGALKSNAQSWQAHSVAAPVLADNCSNNCRGRLPCRTS